MVIQIPEIGTRFRVISKENVRYEGSLLAFDSEQGIITLSNVRSYGTEDRAAATPIPFEVKVQECMSFKGSNIMNLYTLRNPASEITTITTESTPDMLEYFSDSSITDAMELMNYYNSRSSPKNEISSSPVVRNNYNRNGNKKFSRRKKSSKNLKSPASGLYDDYYHTNTNYSDSRNFGGKLNSRRRCLLAPRNGSDDRWYDLWNNSLPEKWTRGYCPDDRAKLVTDNNLNQEVDFDFERANLEFEELKCKFSNMELESTGSDTETDNPPKNIVIESRRFYDKKKSFYDNITCESMTKGIGKNRRSIDDFNIETFGTPEFGPQFPLFPAVPNFFQYYNIEGQHMY